MAKASHKITDFPASTSGIDPALGIPAGMYSQDRDPTREIRSLMDELQGSVQDSKRLQRMAEEERDHLRAEVCSLQERLFADPKQNADLKAVTRERDMLLEQQAQYGPAIAELKAQLRLTQADVRAAEESRSTARREKEQADGQLLSIKKRCTEATRERDAAIRQRDLLRKERDEAREKAAQAQKNFADAQKLIAETQKSLSENRAELAVAKKKAESEQASQFDSLRQVRDGMAAQIKQLNLRVTELEDELAEAQYARESAEAMAQETRAHLGDVQDVLAAAVDGGDTQDLAHLEAAMGELQSELASARETIRTLSEGAADTTLQTAPQESSSFLRELLDASLSERDALQTALTESGRAFEQQLGDKAREIESLSEKLRGVAGRTADQHQLEVHFENRRLEMIDLNTRLENAHREIRNLSASLAEARLHAKLSGNPIPVSLRDSGDVAFAEGSSANMVQSMRRSFQAFSRDQKQLGLLAELETLTRAIAERAVQEEQTILHRGGMAFSYLLGDLQEMPDQVSQSTLRTLNHGIEFIGMLVAEPEIEKSVPLGETSALVVDDDPNICALAADALNLVGVRARQAHSAAEAIEALESEPCDLILLDVHMPNTNGFELCARIRNLSQHAETPIFFVTGDTSIETRVKSSLRGGNEFIAKPFGVQELAVKSLKAIVTARLRTR